MVSRELNRFDATLLVMGGIIGVGIFFTPRTVALSVPDARAFLALWVLGGMMALSGAMTFAELGATFPRAGGWYVFLREIYGPFLAFLFAWIVLCVVSTAAVAVMMSFFTDTLRALFPAIGAPGGPVTLAIGAGTIVLVTVLVLCGVKVGALFQNACMLSKLAAIGVLCIGGLWLASAIDSPVPAVAPPVATGGASLAQGMLAGILPILFTYGGWQMVCYIAPEVRDPERTLPRAILGGTIGVVVVYLVANVAYLRVLGIGGMQEDPAFASTMAVRVLGATGAKVLQLAMAISAVGACTVTIITTPWMYVAMAREKLFFQRFAALHPKTGAPTLALCVQAVLCLGYWFWGQAGVRAQSAVTPDVLTSSVAFVEWVFHALVAIGLLRLRATRKELPRPFRSPLYPLAPVAYAVFALAVVCGNLAQANRRDTAIGLALLAIGAVVYKPWRRLVRAGG